MLPAAGQTAITVGDLVSNPRANVSSAPPRAEAHLVGLPSITDAGYWDIDWWLPHRGRTRAWKLHKVSETAALIFSGRLPM